MPLPNVKNSSRRSSRYGVFSKVIVYTALIAPFAFILLIFFKTFEPDQGGTSLTSKVVTTTQEDSLSSLIRGGNTANEVVPVLPKSLTLMTSQGDIIIELRPNQALESVQYINLLLNSPEPCGPCQFYRAEQKGILQGILKKSSISPNTVLGTCPEEFKDVPKCHGPLMTRGMVGWAAGEGGPDFFIDNYRRPAEWWSHDHTVWGEIVDEESLHVVDSFFDLPTHKQGLTFLDDNVHIVIK